MNIFKSLFEKFKPSFSRFAAMYFFAVAGAVFSSLVFFNDYSKSIFFKHFIADCSVFCIFAVLFQFISERFLSQTVKVKILNFAVPAVLSVPFYFVCRNFFESEYFMLSVYCVTAAMILICGLFVYLESREKTGANILTAFVFANILSVCVGVALTIIIFAVDGLLFSLEFDEWVPSAWVFAYWPLFMGFFVSLVTLKYDEIKISQPFKVVFMYALFPLYWVLIAILYVYFFKSVFTLSLPNGQINWIVSFATVFYILFNAAFRCYQEKVTDIFYKWGGVVLAPLVVIQIVAFAIRVKAYGFIQTRCASLLYIVFSTIVLCVSIAESFVKDKKVPFGFMKTVFVLGAAVFIWACLPFVNIIDSSARSMINVIENIYRKHQMFDEKNGLLITTDAEKTFNSDEKNTIKSAWDEIRFRKNNHEIKWIAYNIERDYDEKLKESVSYKDTFGFEFKWKYFDKSDNREFRVSASKEKVDIKGFSTLKVVNDLIRDKDDGRFYVTISKDTYRWDVTELCQELLTKPDGSPVFNEQIVIDRGTKRLILVYLNYDYYVDEAGTIHFHGSADGYQLEK